MYSATSVSWDQNMQPGNTTTFSSVEAHYVPKSSGQTFALL